MEAWIPEFAKPQRYFKFDMMCNPIKQRNGEWVKFGLERSLAKCI